MGPVWLKIRQLILTALKSFRKIPRKFPFGTRGKLSKNYATLLS